MMTKSARRLERPSSLATEAVLVLVVAALAAYQACSIPALVRGLEREATALVVRAGGPLRTRAR
jgi:hypothetical protein